ncbi:copper homeostasis protein CutC [Photobacterium carnosum]|uniref:copper homeostasis protein CutC n=1 Tax=Photobacterium carnosum TaxID=2023717 RepID=UPI001C8FBFFB|nr:copper homeostasis protein CutC [Photobacterium carnosum]MBY3789656.1 copper homeostasis protein CutC [Photobacterium carnosum]MCD9535135.1 copper homeostasis protein CutC [Photobacterium carnosum]
MTIQLEVCIDNLESLHNAQQAGATRIELCSSLALGGLTPSAGFMSAAAKYATIPVYAMIRPRQGDFLFSSDDVEIMLADIFAAKQARLQGVVVGVLTAQGLVDNDILTSLVKQAQGMGITFHRAIDQCVEPMAALDTIMAAGCERILTSGLQANAYDGIGMINQMHQHCGNHLKIMAGAGVNSHNVRDIIARTGINEIHLSGKTTRPSHMITVAKQAHMGSADIDDFAIPITGIANIAAVVAQLKL